jgi:hypothetical protein
MYLSRETKHLVEYNRMLGRNACKQGTLADRPAMNRSFRMETAQD